MTRYGMAIDQSRCIGCHACAMACKIANNMPADVVYNRVITVGSDYIDCASGTYENPSLEYLRGACLPAGVSYRRHPEGSGHRHCDRG